VVRASDIYGKDVASLKGKTKDRKLDLYNVDFVLFVVKPLIIRLILVQWIPTVDVSNLMKDAVKALCTKVEA
jgi:hypothetical protein